MLSGTTQVTVDSATSGSYYADQGLDVDSLDWIGQHSFRVGNGGSGDAAGVLVFELPALAVGETITDANLDVMLEAINTYSTSDLPANVDLYGLGYRTSAAVQLSDFYVGSLDNTDATLIQNDLAIRTTTTGVLSTDSTADSNLTDYLNAQYAAGGAGNYVFLRLTPDATVATNHRYYRFSTTENSTQANRPVLTMDVSTTEPSALGATVLSSSEIDLAWTDNSDDEVGFEIERSADGTNYTFLASVNANVTSYSDTGLTPSTEYYYRVRADYGSSQYSDYSAAVNATTDEPEATVVSYGLSGNYKADQGITSTTTVDWIGQPTFRIGHGGLGDAAGVFVFQLPTLDSGEAIVDANLDVMLNSINTWSDTDLPANVDVYGLGFRSSADVLLSDHYVGALDTTDATLIQDNIAVRTTSTGMLSTDSTADANLVNYLNAQYAAGGAGNYIFLRLSPDATVPTSNRYYTFSTADNSTQANQPVLTVTIGESPTPAAPSALSATAVSTSQIELNWTDNSTNETSFAIERSTDGTNFTQIDTVNSDVTYYRDNNLDYSTTYYYRVRALGLIDDSDYTSVVNDTTDDLQSIDVPSALDGSSNADVGLSATTIDWIGQPTFRVGRVSTDAAGVFVFQLPELSFGQTVESVDFVVTLISKNTFGSNDLPNVDLYGLGIRDEFDVELTDFYSGQLDTTDATLIQSDFAVQATSIGTVTTDSTGSANLKSYINGLYAAGGAGKYVMLRLNPDATAASTGRYYTFATADNATVADRPDLTLNVTTALPNIPTAPSNLQATADNSTQISLSWTDNSSDETGFIIQRSPDNLHFSNYDTVNANVTTYSDTVSPSTTFYYRVAAVDEGVSAYTTGDGATTPAYDGIAAPTGFAATVTSYSDIDLVWSDDFSNETGYEIQRSTDGINYSALTTTNANVTSYSESNLTADTTYYYRVRANFAAEDSNYAVIKSATIPNFVNTYWVDESATGSAEDGSYDDPYLTVTDAIDQAGAGDGVVIREGEYQEKIDDLPSGTSTSPFTLMGAPGERVVISGFEDLSGWQQHQGDIYVTTLNWEPEYLYVNSTVQPLSTEPNEGWHPVPTVTTNPDTTMTFTDAANLSGIDSLVGSFLRTALEYGVTYTGTEILSHDTTTGTITFGHLTGMAAGDMYRINNSQYFLDEAGEWAVVDQGNGTYNVYFWPEDSADLSNTRSNKMDGRQILLADDDYINIKGLEIAGNTDHGIDILNWSTHINVSDVIVHSNLASGIHVRGAEYITISNSFVTGNGNGGIEIVSTHHATVENSEISYNRVDGILVAGDIGGSYPNGDPNNLTWDITLKNNYIHHHIMWNHPDNIQIYRGVSDIEILDNLILGSGQGLMSEEVDGGVLAGNAFFGSAAINVIFGHSNSDDWEIYDNTIAMSGYSSFSFTGTDYDVHENVFLDPISVTSEYTGDRNLFWTGDSDSNIYTDQSTWIAYDNVEDIYTNTGNEQNSLKADPLYGNVPEAFTYVTAIADIQECTADTLKVTSVEGFEVGDFIELNYDGVVREITDVDETERTISFDVPLPQAPLRYVLVCNWGTRTDFQLDLTLGANSPAATLGADGGTVGSVIDIFAYQSGDFDGDGLRDLPDLPADLLASIPDPNDWHQPSYFPTY